PLLPPAAGAVGGAAGAVVRAAARLFLQQRDRGRGSVSQICAAVLVHARRTTGGIHRLREFVSRANVRRAVGDVERTLPRTIRAAGAGRAVRTGQRSEGAAGRRLALDRGDYRG